MKLEATIQKNGKTLQAELYRSVFTAEPGFTPPEDEILTPELVYQTTRPGDWLPMPMPADDEMYLLGLVYPVVNGVFSAVITHSGNCVVEFFTVENDILAPIKRITPQSGVRFTESILYSDYGNLTSHGAHQYVVRIKGKVSKIDLLKESNNATPNSIVDIFCGLQVNLVCGEISGPHKTLQSLRYLNFVGNGGPTTIITCYANLKKLMSVRYDGPAKQQAAYYVFLNCNSLISVSPNFMGTGKRSIGMSFYSTGLVDIRLLGYASDIDGAFRSSPISVFSQHTIDTQYAQNMSAAFYDCYVLNQVTGLNITSATNVNNMFMYCPSLSRLVFAGETTPGGWTINLTTTALGHEALVEMIASLPTATAAATITITGLPGAAQLTDAEIAVATAKNWTITR